MVFRLNFFKTSHYSKDCCSYGTSQDQARWSHHCHSHYCSVSVISVHHQQNITKIDSNKLEEMNSKEIVLASTEIAGVKHDKKMV